MEGQIFFNEVKASFNLREPKANKPTNIYLVCRIDKKQVKLSTLGYIQTNGILKDKKHM